jgi:hypothetical protein
MLGGLSVNMGYAAGRPVSCDSPAAVYRESGGISPLCFPERSMPALGIVEAPPEVAAGIDGIIGIVLAASSLAVAVEGRRRPAIAENGALDASQGAPERMTERAQGHVPLVLVESPRPPELISEVA